MGKYGLTRYACEGDTVRKLSGPDPEVVEAPAAPVEPAKVVPTPAPPVSKPTAAKPTPSKGVQKKDKP